MIARHLDRDGRSSDLVRLVEYLTDTQDKKQRIGEMFTANCESADPDFALQEMRAVQEKNTRASGDKTYHLLVSFRPGEEPGREVLEKIEKEICERLGFGQHQRIAVVHHDTDNVHMHVAINKIHPTKKTVHTPYQDYVTLGRTAVELERKHQLERDNHDPTERSNAEQIAQDIAALAGGDTFVSWVKRELAESMKSAATWEDLHRELAKAGLVIKLRGNGSIITDSLGDTAKASSVDREFSKSRLEKRLGKFQPPAEAEAIPIKEKSGYAQLAAEIKEKLWKEYTFRREESASQRQAKLDAITAEYRLKFSALQKSRTADYLAAKRGRVGFTSKRKLYAALREKHRAEVAKLRAATHQARKEIYRADNKSGWLEWLQAEAKIGREEALALLRSRASYQAKKSGQRIQGQANPAKVVSSLPVDSVTKRGTVIYQVGREAIRDDGNAFKVSRQAELDTVVTALRLAKQRYGKTLDVYGDPAFQEKAIQAAVAGNLAIRFSDPILEERRRETLRTSLTPKEQTKGDQIENER